MSDPKLCKNCKHYRARIFDECRHPKNVHTNLITGDKSLRFRPDELRTFGPCWVRGDLFEAKVRNGWLERVANFVFRT